MSEQYRVADYISDFIADKGIGHVFLLPGGGAMFLNDAVAKNKRLQGIPCHHEQACTIAAEAYSRVHERPGVSMVTTGPGATNAITGVVGAWIESVPLLIISGQVKRPDLLKDSPLRQKGVQEVDIVTMVKSVTKYAKTIQHPEDIRKELEKAYELATTGRAGPVWIDVPLDVQAAPVDASQLQGYQAGHIKSPEISQVTTKLAELLKTSKRPLILAGHGVRLARGEKVFRELVDELGIPVVTTWNAMDLLPYEHPLNIGRPGVVALRAPNFAVQNCDLLISIGSRLDNIVTAFNQRGFARVAKKVVVDIDANEIDKLSMDIDLKVVSDAKTFLESLKHFSASPDRAWIELCQSWKMKYREEAVHSTKTEHISHYQAVKALSQAIGKDTLISTGSSGLAVEFFYTLFENKPGQRIFLTSGLGSMGYGLPAAIGSCYGNGKKPMVAIESDGSLQLNIQELATLRAGNLPICLIILNNNGYASIRNTQRNYFSSRFIGTGPEANLWMPSLQSVSATYEIPYVKIEKFEELNEKLTKAIAMKSMVIVEVFLENNESLAPKVSALPQKDGSMISMPLEDMSPLLPLADLEKEMLVPLLQQSYKARENT
jgi:acetolactate synthase-1/2/3 large subunit